MYHHEGHPPGARDGSKSLTNYHFTTTKRYADAKLCGTEKSKTDGPQRSITLKNTATEIVALVRTFYPLQLSTTRKLTIGPLKSP